MIQTGVSYFDVSLPGWNLSTGTGSRRFQSPDIRFNQSFPVPPKIVLALSGIESVGNLTVQLYPEDIEPEEFNIIIDTWGDAVLHKVIVTWIAFD